MNVNILIYQLLGQGVLQTVVIIVNLVQKLLVVVLVRVIHPVTRLISLGVIWVIVLEQV